MPRYYQTISADGHVETPPSTWTKYVPEKYRDRAPKLVQLDSGGEGWVVENRPMLNNGLNITGPKGLAPGADSSGIIMSGDSYWLPDGTAAPGAGLAEQRLREQDQDGIDAEILYPPIYVTRFIEGIRDKNVYLSMVRAYNTFLAQDFCSVAPDRLFGNAVVPMTGVDDAVTEMKRCKEMGIVSVSPHQFPNGGGSPAPEDDRFWGAALEMGMRISPHGSIGDPTSTEAARAGMTGFSDDRGMVSFAAQALGAGRTSNTHFLAQFIAHGALDRFPELQLYIAETNASWLPHALWFIDDTYKQRRNWFGVTLKMLPSEYIKKHFYFSFIRDPMAMKLRDYLPVDNLMWGSDFPHSVGSFPNSQGWLDIIFDGVPDDIRHRVLVETPAKFLGIDLSKPITETPGVPAAAR